MASLSTVMQRCESACDVFEQGGERAVECGMAGDDDIVAGGARMLWGRCGERRLQPSANPVAGDGIADLLRNREAKACRPAVFCRRPFPYLDQECWRRGTTAAADGQEFRARLEGLQYRNPSLQS